MNVGSYVVVAIGIVSLCCVICGLTVLARDEIRDADCDHLDAGYQEHAMRTDDDTITPATTTALHVRAVAITPDHDAVIAVTHDGTDYHDVVLWFSQPSVIGDFLQVLTAVYRQGVREL